MSELFLKQARDEHPAFCFFCGKRRKKDEELVYVEAGDGRLACHAGVCTESCADAIRGKQEELL